ncbi:MAG TPA: lysophospholipid acyltransferase family protein [Bacteroidales bacterium]|nr:lysophospholipid acyltransferase family protein [Bacteroidales bacterium]
MIIRAKHHVFIYPFFRWYSRRIINRHFEQVVLKGEFLDQRKSVLLVSNHVSWWDGFWAMYLNLEIFKRKFHFMMLKNQLLKYWYFNYSGGYSIEPDSRSALESIDYTAGLLSNSGNLVLIFPQGKLESMHRQNFTFRKGIERILERTGKETIQIVFLVNITEYLSKQKPTLYQYIEEYSGAGTSVSEIQEHYNVFCRSCFEHHLKMEE